MSPAELLAAYDAEVRASYAAHLPSGWSAEVDGPVLRCRAGDGGSGFGYAMLTRPALELGEADLEALVERTVAHLGDLETEWKTWDHDHGGLRDVLARHGFAPDDHEALVIGEAAPLASDPVLPDGLTLRETRDRADLDRIDELSRLVWDDPDAGHADDLEAQLAGGDPVHVFLVEHGETLVSAARIELVPGTRFAGLWGGNTHPDYRGQGVYRALVAVRAQLALGAGHTLLQVDASDDSRPILERSGLTVVGGTQPWIRPL